MTSEETTHPTASAAFSSSTYIDLLSSKYGGQALACSDDFFASKDNLVKSQPPVFIDGKFTENGKWMDGWESRRRRGPGHDWCLLRLGLAGIIRAVTVDTTHFRGNAPASVSIDACNTQGEVDTNSPWQQILADSPVAANTENLLPITSTQRWTHLRLHIYPDGGVARLRAWGEVTLDRSQLLPGELIDLAASSHGGRSIACSDMFFGSMHNLLAPGRGQDMGDGWETRRRRGPGHDWVIVQLGAAAPIRRIEVDTHHFKGNYPESCSIEGILSEATDLQAPDLLWTPLLANTHLQPDRIHRFQEQILDPEGRYRHIRLKIFPDGGISRLRIYGHPAFDHDD